MSLRFPAFLYACLCFCLACSPLFGQTTPLPFQPIDAQYSKALDRIVMISASPNQVHLYDPVTNTDSSIGLPRAPLSFSVSPDGLRAVVGHDGMVSYLNLQNMTVDRTYTEPFTVNLAALGTGYAYLFTSNGAKWLELATGNLGDFTILQAPKGAAVDPANSTLYVSASRLQEFDISNGIPLAFNDDPTKRRNFAYDPTGRITVAADGSRAYGSCPGFAELPSTPRQPFTQLAKLPVTLIQSISDAPAQKKLAVIQGGVQTCTGQIVRLAASDKIELFDSSSFDSIGTLQISPLPLNGGSVIAAGKYVFFDRSGDRLFAISQANSPAGTPGGFEVHVFDLAHPPVCAPVINMTAANVPASGIVGSVAASAPIDCQYQATTSASWLQIVSGSYNGGNGVIRYLARPNTTTNPRSAEITIGNQKLTITQEAGKPIQPLTRLGFPIAAADYSKALDRLILVSAMPNELHIYDPVTGDDRITALPRIGLSVAVSPDGLHAAVGHSGLVTYIDLQTGSIEKTIPASVPAEVVGVTSKGLLYYGDVTPGYASIHAASLTTGDETTVAFTNSAGFRLHPSGSLLYTWAQTVFRWRLSDTEITFTPVGIALPCGNAWFAENGSRYYTACGRAYVSSTDDSLDGIFQGAFSGIADPAAPSTPSAQWIVNSTLGNSDAAIGRIGAAGDTSVALFGDSSFTPSGTFALPALSIGSDAYATHGRYAFWSKNSDRLIVIAQTDEATPQGSAWVVDVVSPSSNASGCAVALSPSSASGNSGQISITSGSNCVWRAQSSAPWLTLSGAFGSGSGVLEYFAAPNSAMAARTATITVQGQTFTFTQAGSGGSVSTGPHSATVQAGGGAGSFPLTVNSPGDTWTAVSDSSWLTITSGASGTGNGQINFSAAPTPLLTSRTATILAAGQSFQVTQSGATVSLSYPMGAIDANGGRINVHYTADSPALTVNPVPNAPWITISGISTQTGQTSGDFWFTIAATDSLAARSATITVAGQQAQISQAPARVTLPVSSAPPINGLSGGSFYVISTSYALPLNPQPTVSWIKVKRGCCDFPASFYTISYTLDVNPGPQRTGGIQVGDQLFVITQAGAGIVPLRFNPIPPCRLVDTRNTTGPFGGPALSASGVRDFALPTAACNLPSNAMAYSLNITAAPQGPLGFLTVYPSGQARPEVSTLNSYDGRVVANAAIIPAGTGGGISVFATDATNVVIDVNGYFDSMHYDSLAFYTLNPCRAVDTRNPSDAFGGPGLKDASRSFDLANSVCRPPASAQAYSLNVTAVPSGTLNYLTIWPKGQSQPGVSTLNSYDGSVVANAALAPSGSNGGINAFASGSTDFLLDLNGFFAVGGTIPNAAPLNFYALAPCRVADTRGATGQLGAPSLAANAVRNFPVSGSCGIPTTAQAYAMNVTVVPKANALHFLTLWPSGQNRPEVSTLNSYQGKVLANFAIVPAGTNGAVSAFATEDTELILDVTGYFAP